MRCLVSGASGHVGSYLTRRLVDSGAEVYALVRPESDLWRLSGVQDRIQVLRGELSALSTLAPEIKRVAPDAVFHLAWYGVSGDYRDDPQQISRNVVGSLELFDIAQQAGCKLWVGIGSQAEYGPFSGLLTEDVPTNPTTVYGVSKLCVGMLTQKLAELVGMRWLWLRLLASYGPTDDTRHMIPSVIRQLLCHECPSLTQGEQSWDYLYVEDVAEAIYKAAESGACGIFNVGSGSAYTVRHVVEQIRDIVDPALPVGFGEVPYRSDQVMHLQADTSKLRQATGWEPRTALDEGLRRTVDWYRRRTIDDGRQ